MCGRFTLKEVGSLADLFQLPPPAALEPRHNIAPTQQVAAVRVAPDRDERELVLLRWGLIPAWAQDPAAMSLMINARAETAATKPAFRSALRRRRCLVPADGFYEWQSHGRQKQPFHIRMRDDSLFALAALWERWQSPDGVIIDSCALLTVEANELMRTVHDRMPVILDAADFDLWLDPQVQEVEMLQPLLRPYPSEAMVAYPVSTLVNNARNDDPQCLLALE
jgi:putative SOS response-associated peptidase YedK